MIVVEWLQIKNSKAKETKMRKVSYNQLKVLDNAGKQFIMLNDGTPIKGEKIQVSGSQQKHIIRTIEAQLLTRSNSQLRCMIASESPERVKVAIKILKARKASY